VEELQDWRISWKMYTYRFCTFLDVVGDGWLERRDEKGTSNARALIYKIDN